jgi:hypothetical protein
MNTINENKETLLGASRHVGLEINAQKTKIMIIWPRSKNEWCYTSTPQYAFMAWCSVKKKHRDNFTFTLPLPSELRTEPECKGS